jgi:hypothetical protein
MPFIYFYLSYCFISDVILSKLSLRLLGSEIYSYRVFTIIEFSLIALFFTSIIASSYYKRLIYVSMCLFYFLLIIDFFTNSFNKFDSLPTGIESILIILFCILLIFEKLNSENLHFNYTIWISFALIIFFAGTFFLFILSQNNFNNTNFSDTYGYVVAIFNSIKNLLIGIGILSESRYNFKKLQGA